MTVARSKFGLFIARLMVLALLNFAIPSQLFAPGVARFLRSLLPEPLPDSRPLATEEMEGLRGRGTIRNPYNAGSQKWSVVYKGVDLLTGNFSMASTDLSFEGGYGIPVNVTRSYSANNGDEGPLGTGWTLSVDIRSTAGGMLKSSSGPVRSVPVSYRERPVAEDIDPRDPNIGYPITEGVIATDAAGFEETIQRDVDGVLTEPPWDKNRTETEYELVKVGDNVWSVPVSMTVRTPDGTVYTYERMGTFYDPNDQDLPGIMPIDDGFGHDPNKAQPSNLLKITTVTDRHGNVTQYTYDTGTEYKFWTIRGWVKENPLTRISMPSGQVMNFVWGEVAPGVHRITEANDSGFRSVFYGYNGNGNLTSVTLPGNLVTTFDYGPVDGGVVNDLLTRITDPRGLVTELAYVAAQTRIYPYDVGHSGVWCYRITHPNGHRTYFSTTGITSDNLPGEMQSPTRSVFADYTNEYTSGTRYNLGILDADVWPTSSVFRVQCFQTDAVDGMEYTPVGGHVPWQRLYSIYTMDLLEEAHFVFPYLAGDLRDVRGLVGTAFKQQEVRTVSTYNFQGNPLSRTVTETTHLLSGGSITKSYATEYAYHGPDKYYQQKAVKDPKGRFTFTDYFDDQAAQGKKGQVYRVYDPKHATFDPGQNWRYDISVTGGHHSAEFDYDQYGRPTDVWKLKDASPTYVRTHTIYGSAGVPFWGNPVQVFEDYQGTDERMTETLEYDHAGRATEVRDAAGRTFITAYNAAGQVERVQLEEQPGQPDDLVTYTYGTSGVSNAMVIEVTDWVFDITQKFIYDSDPGPSIGQIETVEEYQASVSPSYSVSYAYNEFADRETATYVTPNGTTQWKYMDYIRVGTPDNPRRVFQTLNKQVSGQDSAEELHYQFDSAGRLTMGAYAQTPSLQQPEWDDILDRTSWYTTADPASTRARTYYEYDPSGRALGVWHWWDTLGQGGYASEPILAYRYYPAQGPGSAYYDAGGLRTGVDYLAASGGGWSLIRHESYTYDTLDQLASVDYGDGGSGAWTYDAAGNRSNQGYTYDNLNRMTASPGFVYQNDVLGNRTWRNYGQSGVQRYVWDELNRLKSLSGTEKGARYEYRADGMRAKKVEGLTIAWNPGDEIGGSGYYDEVWAVNKPTTRYYYDGQMCLEEDYTYDNGGTPGLDVTRYGVGARGIDLIERIVNQGAPSVTFPLYDGHGNMTATLSRSGASFTVSNQRSYDVWGGVRSGSTSGFPNTRYVANLGHKQDDESDLIYMRARYYEPWTGRFISEDPARDGWNWYVYASSSPVTAVDAFGTFTMADVVSSAAFRAALRGGGLNAYLSWLKGESPAAGFVIGFLTGGAGFLGSAKDIWYLPGIVNAFVAGVKEILGGGGPGSALRKAILGFGLGSLAYGLANWADDALDAALLNIIASNSVSALDSLLVEFLLQ